MKICKHCGYENDDSFTYCGNCGKRIDGKKECQHCHFLFDDRMKYCPNCGEEYIEKKDSIIMKKVEDLKENKSVLDKFSLGIFITIISLCLIGIFVPYYTTNATMTGALASLNPSIGSLYLLFNGNYYSSLIECISKETSDSGYAIDIIRLIYIGVLAILTIVFSLLSLINLLTCLKSSSKIKWSYFKTSLISYFLLVLESALLSYGEGVKLFPYFIVFLVITILLMVIRYIYKEIFISNEKFLFKYVKDAFSFLASLFLIITLIEFSFNQLYLTLSPVPLLSVSGSYNAIGGYGIDSNQYGLPLALLFVFIFFTISLFLKLFTKSEDKIKYIIFSSLTYILFFAFFILVSSGFTSSENNIILSGSFKAGIALGIIALVIDVASFIVFDILNLPAKRKEFDK